MDGLSLSLVTVTLMFDIGVYLSPPIFSVLLWVSRIMYDRLVVLLLSPPQSYVCGCAMLCYAVLCCEKTKLYIHNAHTTQQQHACIYAYTHRPPLQPPSSHLRIHR
jgi:hypothetical protein